MRGSIEKGITPSQTVGPFFKYGLTPNGQYDWNDAFTSNLVTADASGERIRVEGRVFDGDGQPVADCMLEIWQADAQGRFSDPQDKRAQPNSTFRGFGRCGTDPNGTYAFDTIRPGTVPDPDGKPQAPHLLVAIFARGMLLHLYTRVYFDGEAANAAGLITALLAQHGCQVTLFERERFPRFHIGESLIPQTFWVLQRLGILIATRHKGSGNAVYHFDIHLQGDNETVFFEL